MAKQTKQLKKKRTVSAAAPFASFMRIAAEDQTEQDEQARRAEKEEEWAKKAETDPDREQLEDESDDDYATRMEEMDDEEAEGEIKDDPEAEDEKDDEKAKAIRSSERARCAQIVAYGIKLGNVNQAAVLAFDTSLSASQAISTMKASQMDVGASSTQNGLHGRMSNVPNHNVGNHMPAAGGRHANKDQATASSILDSVNAARG
ncbi:hypothetical protein [Acinetobacter modestus]|uniref:hypothetical protein n=1 Tax=Acinetobacter modestus TaxID=1776740 RepID=UPI00301A9DA3